MRVCRFYRHIHLITEEVITFRNIPKNPTPSYEYHSGFLHHL
jgi:hypothetical protein